VTMIDEQIKRAHTVAAKLLLLEIRKDSEKRVYAKLAHRLLSPFFIFRIY